MIATAHDQLVDSLTYGEYRAILSYYLEGRKTAGPLDLLKTKLLEPVLNMAQRMVQEYGLKIEEILFSLKKTKMFQFLKAIRFRLEPLLKGIRTAFKLTRMGLNKITEEIVKSGILNKVRDGTVKVDEFLRKYPIIKQFAGPVLAGLLLWCWLSMSFIGDPATDFDLMDVANAFVGKYTLTDLLTSQSGIETILLTVLGLTTGISFPWLGSSVFQLFVAIVATGCKAASRSAIFRSIKRPVFQAASFLRKHHAARTQRR